jgi:hypothetical protein
MDVLIRNEPPAGPHNSALSAEENSDTETRKISSLVLAQELLGVRDIVRDPQKRSNDGVRIDLEQVYWAKDQLYIRYSVTNQSKAPFRLTTPDVAAPLPTQQPISLLSLRNHQLSPQTFAAFKAKEGSTLLVMQAETVARDLAPGEKTTGVISVRTSLGNTPQLFQLNFGTDQNRPLKVEAVL